MKRVRLDCPHCKSAGSVEHGVCQVCLTRVEPVAPTTVATSDDGARTPTATEGPHR